MEQARRSGVPLVQVQHHHAHVASCAAENGLETDYLGVAWDGAGLGLDGVIWGGEFFLVTSRGFERIAHLRSFPLPGGEAAMRDCARPAAGLLRETLGADRAGRFIDPRIATLLESGAHTPLTSSVGRLFDAVAYLTGLSRQNLFEGQAAMSLERAAGATQSDECYRIPGGDWAPLIGEMVADIDRRTAPGIISAKFHNTLANWILEVACASGVRQVVLSGGVFQNTYLTHRALRLLRADGFTVFTHHQVPPNDGGLALGQAVLAGQPGAGS
jgi:hydrogenase maturation protein HypF